MLPSILVLNGRADIQIDYEYPKTSAEATAYVQLLAELRQGLEQLAQQKGRTRGQYQLTIAAPCGADNMKVLRVKEMDQYLDFWNLMVSTSECASFERRADM
jgi:chitinase